MAIYNSTHTGQEIDNAVDKLNSIKLFRYDVNLAFVDGDSNTYQADFSFYSSIENIGNNINDLMNAIFGAENVSKTYYNMFETKEFGNSIVIECRGIYKQYDNVLLRNYYNIIKANEYTDTYVVIEEVTNIEIIKTKIM